MHTNNPYEWSIYGIPSEYVLGDDAYTPDDYAGEMWKESLLEGIMVSDHGRFYDTKTGKFKKPTHGDNHGHLAVKVGRNGRRSQAYAHRLIAQAFIPNSNESCDIVRHLDDDPSNNEVGNLAWGTARDNHDDCVRNGHHYVWTDEDREASLRRMRIPVYAINNDTGERTLYLSQAEAASKLGIHQANVYKVLKGGRSHTGGYRFEYAGKEHGDGRDD